MVRIVDHNTRKNKVLAYTVSAYINNSEPVSSQVLSERFGLSSATMRNILAELEDEGYLFHPHTSSGRIPSGKGYRYYVDFLMSQEELAQDKKSNILVSLESPKVSLEDLLEQTSGLIADLTHYTSLVSFPSFGDKIFFKGLGNIMQQPEFHDLEKLALLVKLLEERKQLLEIINQDSDKPLRVYIGEEINSPLGEICSLVVSTYKKGNKDKGRLAVLGPRRMSYEQTMSTLEFISDALTHILEDF